MTSPITSPYPSTPAAAKAYRVLMVERPELSIPQARAMFASLSADLVNFTLGVAQREGLAALAQWSRYDQARPALSLAVAPSPPWRWPHERRAQGQPGAGHEVQRPCPGQAILPALRGLRAEPSQAQHQPARCGPARLPIGATP